MTMKILRTFMPVFTAFALSISPAVTQSAPTISADVSIPPERLQTLISDAITWFEHPSRQQWGFQVARFEDEEGEITRRTERYSPQMPRGSRWSLISVDGKIPDEKQLSAYAKRRKKPEKDGREAGFTIKLRELIQLDQLQLTQASAESLIVRFPVHIDRLGKKTSEKLSGSLVYNIPEQFIESIQIHNLEPVSPVLGAYIDDFRLTLDFVKIQDTVLPKKQQLDMSGTWAFFKEIKEVSQDTYSHFQNTTTQSQVL